MTDALNAVQEWAITTDRVGKIVQVHEAADCKWNPCPFHNASVWPLALAEAVWVPVLGLYRLCAHGVEHPDVDDLRRAEMPPTMFKTIINTHDRSCDGCCHGLPPEESNPDAPTERIDRTPLHAATPDEVFSPAALLNPVGT